MPIFCEPQPRCSPCCGASLHKAKESMVVAPGRCLQGRLHETLILTKDTRLHRGLCRTSIICARFLATLFWGSVRRLHVACMRSYWRASGSQNYGPMVGTFNVRGHIIDGTQRKAMTLTTYHTNYSPGGTLLCTYAGLSSQNDTAALLMMMTL